MHTQNSEKPYTSLSIAVELEIFGFRSVLSEIRKKWLTERHAGRMLKSTFSASLYHEVIERVDCLFVENTYFCLLYVVQIQCFKLALITLLEYPTRVIPATSTQFFSACFLKKNSWRLLWNTIKLSTVRMVSSCFLLNCGYFFSE